MFVEEREPSSVQEMSKLAEHFLQIHGKTYNNWSGSDAGRPDKSRSHFNDKPSSTKVTQGESSSYKHRTQSTLNNNPGEKKKACWICSSTDHMKNNCPMKDKFRGKSVKPALQCEEVAHVVLSDGTCIPMRLADDGKSIYTQDGQKVQITAFHSSIQKNMPTIYGRVPGCDRDVLVLRDTGCSGAVIRQSLCKPEEFTGETQACLLMDGTICESPVVIKMIDTPYYSGKVRGIAMPCPVYDVEVGNLEGARPADKPDPDWKPMDITEAGAVVTRAQNKLKPLTPLMVAKSSQLKVDGKQLREMQCNDPSLKKVRDWITDGKGENPRKRCREKYFWDDTTKILMREYATAPEKGSRIFNQVMLPGELRLSVMEVAHDSILGGHLGTQKTIDRVLSSFFWPGVHADVTRYCQSCGICQRTVPKGKIGKAPLGTMPIISTPFTRVSIDLIGPSSVSGRGHRWVLTLVDWATRYPEAIALNGIETKEVAEALVSIFSRVEIPIELLTYKGTQFTSNLMSEIARLLSVEQLFTTPYHAMWPHATDKWNDLTVLWRPWWRRWQPRNQRIGTGIYQRYSSLTERFHKRV